MLKRYADPLKFKPLRTTSTAEISWKLIKKNVKRKNLIKCWAGEEGVFLLLSETTAGIYSFWIFRECSNHNRSCDTDVIDSVSFFLLEWIQIICEKADKVCNVELVQEHMRKLKQSVVLYISKIVHVNPYLFCVGFVNVLRGEICKTSRSSGKKFMKSFV